MGGKNQTTTSNSTQSYTPNGQSQLNSIWNAVQGAASTPYQPYTGQQVAGLNSTQQSGINNINASYGASQPLYDQSQQYATAGAQPISASQIANYSNPYTQSVIDATQKNFNESNSQQQSQLLGSAAQQGALGGDRSAVAQAELSRQQNLAQNPVIANLQSQNYQQALSAAQQDRSAQGQAAYTFGALAPAEQNTRLQGAQAQLGAGSVAQQNQQQQL